MKTNFTADDLAQELTDIENFLKATDRSLEEEAAALRAALRALYNARPSDENWDDIRKQVTQALRAVPSKIGQELEPNSISRTYPKP